MRQNRCTVTLLSFGLFAAALPARADVSDPAAARGQLQQGYALKQQGKCAEALPHFAESIRLDRQPKALLNMSDCEAKTGKLVSGQAHAVEARDLARSRGLPDFEKLALAQLKDLDERMPKLVISLAKDAPSGTTVTRDGAELGAISIGSPLPIDPGSHTVAARGGGFERSFPFTLAERETKTLEVTPIGGTPLPQEAHRVETHDAPKPPTTLTTEVTTEVQPAPLFNGQRIAAVSLAGAGLVGMGVSVALAASAKSAWKEAADQCPGGICPNAADADKGDNARKRGNVATAVFIVGAASFVTGGVLWFTVHRDEKTALQFSPEAGPSYGGLAFHGKF